MSRKRKKRAEDSTAASEVAVATEASPLQSLGMDEGAERVFPLPERRGAGFTALLKRSVLNEIHRHGRSTLEVEVCGVLVGNLYRDEAGPWVYVEACIRGNAAEGKSAQVTFTADTWTAIQNEMDAKHPDQRIVGWYHTHPGFGVFLSGMDLFIQEHFFNLPWQVALVHDPRRMQDGMFLWRDGKTEREPMLVEEDEPADDPPTGIGAAGGAAEPAQDMAEPEDAEEEDLLVRVRRLEARQRVLFVLLAVLGIVSIIWPLIFQALGPYQGAGWTPAVPSSQPTTLTSTPRDKP